MAVVSGGRFQRAAIFNTRSTPQRTSRGKSVVMALHTNHFSCDPTKTLFLFPCSGSKEKNANVTVQGPTILQELSPEVAKRLALARDEVNSRLNHLSKTNPKVVPIDESTMLPAWKRYLGFFYTSARQGISTALQIDVPMIIVSGGYGLILADEPIGYYQSVFNPSWWPNNVLEDVLADYVQHRKLVTVCAVASATTGYAKLIRSIDWTAAGIRNAWLFTPRATARSGAQLKVPRAQGEALTQLVTGTIETDWMSSDGLSLTACKLTQPVDV